MFEFLKRRSAKRAATELLVVFEGASQLLSPERFVTELDGATYAQPLLVTLNRLSGAKESERFFPLNYEKFVSAIGSYVDKKLTKNLVEIGAGDFVLTGLITAAAYEHDFRRKNWLPDEHNRRAEIEAKAREIIAFLNRFSSAEAV